MTNSLLKKILITGGNGQLAQALAHHENARHFQLTLCNRADMDITNPISIKNICDKLKPGIIINAGAYTAVDKAEQESEQADRVNHLGAKNMAEACAERSIPLIHLSTDYVFDGTSNTPYTESDAPNPINIYGKTKWQGEEAIRASCSQHIILRVSGIFSAYGNNFFNTMLKLNKTKPDLRVVADQYTCPTYAGDIAGTLLTLIKNLTHFGTYHYCSTPPTSWHHFAEFILQRDIPTITTAEYPTAAKRPMFSALDCSKIAADYGIEQPSWEKAVWKLQ